MQERRVNLIMPQNRALGARCSLIRWYRGSYLTQKKIVSYESRCTGTHSARNGASEVIYNFAWCCIKQVMPCSQVPISRANNCGWRSAGGVLFVLPPDWGFGVTYWEGVKLLRVPKLSSINLLSDHRLQEGVLPLNSSYIFSSRVRLPSCAKNYSQATLIRLSC